MSTDIGSESEDEHAATDIVLAKCDSSDNDSLCSSDKEPIQDHSSHEEPIQDQDDVTNEDDIYYMILLTFCGERRTRGCRVLKPTTID